jgi:hypothetical protein
MEQLFGLTIRSCFGKQAMGYIAAMAEGSEDHHEKNVQVVFASMRYGRTLLS